MKGKRIVFDDSELADWLIDLIADGPENFLQVLAGGSGNSPMRTTTASSARR